MQEDIVLIDKPKGITSFDVIRQLRKKMNIKKMGHAGTLDPMASGLMVIGVGSGTKKLTEYIGLPKTYEAEVMLGIRTITSDLDGEMVEEKPVPDVSAEEVVQVLNNLIGKQILPVSVYSAVKKEGKPLYKRARAGENVIAPMREMEIMGVDFKKFDGVHVTFSIDVSSGTYIRSIAEEIGKQLGTVATLSMLRRTRIGDFSIENAERL